MIHVTRDHATPKQQAEMLETLGIYIKTAVDTEREILAGGGQLHADCEAALLEDGSQQRDIWGADWIPFKQEVAYESLINLKPRQNNREMKISDPKNREKVKKILKDKLGKHERPIRN